MEYYNTANADAEDKESKKESKFKNILNSLLRLNGKNLKLWCMLALIPLTIVFFVYLYGSYNFDSSVIKESDNDMTDISHAESFDISEDKQDFAKQLQQKMVLPKPKVLSSNTTTKEDKRLLDKNGNMVTVELQAGQTLQSVAKAKFGNEAFWVYFFDVNRDKLSSPDDIKAGMRLYVPNPEYFGFSASNQSSVQYAKHRASEILGNAKQ